MNARHKWKPLAGYERSDQAHQCQTCGVIRTHYTYAHTGHFIYSWPDTPNSHIAHTKCPPCPPKKEHDHD